MNNEENKELNVDTEENTFVGDLTLKKPILIDGEEVKKIHYDFENLTGEALENAFKDMIQSRYAVGSSYELDPVAGAHIFAEASGLAYMDIKRLSLADYSEASSIARDFFISGLSGRQGENN